MRRIVVVAVLPFAFVASGLGATTSALAQPTAPAASSSTPSPSANDSAAAAPPPSQATGYGYSDPKPRRRRGADDGGAKGARGAGDGALAGGGKKGPRRVAHASGPVATLAGFEVLADGGSRVFVALTQPVQVEEKRAAGALTYVLPGVHVRKHNDTNPLVALHFNTPVSRARLVPAGHDLHLVVDLRQAATPSWKVVPAKDGGQVLQVDFAAGSYLPAQAVPSPAAPPAEPEGAAEPTPSSPP